MYVNFIKLCNFKFKSIVFFSDKKLKIETIKISSKKLKLQNKTIKFNIDKKNY